MGLETKFLSVSDFDQKEYTIKAIGKHISYGKEKTCLEFEELVGVWPLSKSNTNDLSFLFGEESSWAGKRIEVYKSEMEIENKKVPCMKVRVPVRRFLK